MPLAATSPHWDKINDDRWRKEIETLDKRNQNLRRANDDLMKQVFTASQRGHRLALDLGFDDLDDAESAIAADPSTFNRDAIGNLKDLVRSLREDNRHQHTMIAESEEAHRLTGESLRRVEAENQQLKTELEQLKSGVSGPADNGRRHAPSGGKENSRPLQSLSAQSNETANGDQSRSARKPSRDTEASLKLELSHLQRRYDELLKVKERAADRYKKDYKKWGEFKAWLFAETTNDNDILRALDPEQRKRYKSLVRSKKKKVWKDIGPGLGGEDDLRAAEDHTMDIGGPSGAFRVKTEDDAAILPDLAREPQTNTAHPVSRVATPRNERSHIVSPYVRHVPPVSTPIESPTRSGILVPTSSPLLENQDLSELWGDTSSSNKRKFVEIDHPVLSSSSETDDSQAPNFVPVDGPSTLHHASKVRRTASTDGMSSGTKLAAEPETPKLSATLVPKAMSAPSKRTGKEVARGQLDDYMKYKSRGRYAKAGQNDGDTTINALYEIDKSRNDGMDFEYDAVVRNRDERRRLEAGDCECCRDYYEAVGPLPQRLQQPQWRSPPSSPAADAPRQCQHKRHGKSIPEASSGPSRARGAADIVQHRQEISRHRHNWERPTTPPGYWNIGFPDTQEAAGINEQAKEIHRRKKERVEAEARKQDGRYRKR